MPFKFNKKITNKELNYKINYKIPENYQNVLNEIEGFYGMIGPDINITTIQSLYDLFTGDGNIQGVFFNRGNLTFIKHFIRTDKVKYEEKYGKISKDIFTMVFMMIMNKMKLFPNIMGVANTALLNINNNVYALFERDLPYSVFIDFENKTVGMDKKIELNNINYISGHSKYDIKENTIHTIEYHVSTQCVNYYRLFEDFKIKKKTIIHTKYLPIVHDFAMFNRSVLITDSPFIIKMSNMKKIPVHLDTKKPTFLHIIDTNTSKIETYNSSEGFYIFHYADVSENDDFITIYAPIYESMDFSNLNIYGKYRKIIMDKRTKNVNIEKNTDIDKYNLDFPIKYKNKIVLRNIYNNTINGFVICENLNITKTIMLNNRYVCGEPVIIEIEGIPHIIAFSYDRFSKGHLLVINMENSGIINIPLNCSLNIGFHSLFLENITK
jgi:carotenoid cleavage dioxygenase-like enzyme